ncbi:hypothetical protein AJ87_46080 [Rhizobium yanglingense]|nr:hypothetical protein AJ87_46080 [Rhizobium yanglingense]
MRCVADRVAADRDDQVGLSLRQKLEIGLGALADLLHTRSRAKKKVRFAASCHVGAGDGLDSQCERYVIRKIRDRSNSLRLKWNLDFDPAAIGN